MTGRPDPNKERRAPGSTRPKPRPSQREREAQGFGEWARYNFFTKPYDVLAGQGRAVNDTVMGASYDAAGALGAIAGFPKFAADMEQRSDQLLNRAQQSWLGLSSAERRPDADYTVDRDEFEAMQPGSGPAFPGAPGSPTASKPAPEPFSREGARDVPVRSLAEMRQALAAERQQNAEDMARMKMLDMVQGYDEAIASAKTPEEAEALKMQQFSLLERLLGNGDVALSQFLENQ